MKLLEVAEKKMVDYFIWDVGGDKTMKFNEKKQSMKQIIINNSNYKEEMKLIGGRLEDWVISGLD